MDMDKIIQILIIKELLEELIYEDDNPIQGYEKDGDVDNENLWG